MLCSSFDHLPAAILAGGGDETMRSKIDESSSGVPEAMRQERQVAFVVPAEVLDK